MTPATTSTSVEGRSSSVMRPIIWTGLGRSVLPACLLACPPTFCRLVILLALYCHAHQPAFQLAWLAACLFVLIACQPILDISLNASTFAFRHCASVPQTVESRLKVTLPENLPEALRDGVVLCHLANQIRPRSVQTIHVPSPAVVSNKPMFTSTILIFIFLRPVILKKSARF